jgi:hypothetical protein
VERLIDISLPGPLFGDGAGGPQAIGTLPLAAGYKTAFYNLDMVKQKVKLRRRRYWRKWAEH